MSILFVDIIHLNIEWIRLSILIILFSIGSYMDVKSRIVSDKIWFIGSMIASLFFVYDIVDLGFQIAIFNLFISIIFVGGIAYLFYYTRVFYGADYKGFLVIAMLAPTKTSVGANRMMDDLFNVTPSDIDLNNIIELIQLSISHGVLNTFGFAVLVNASLAGCLFFIWNLFINIKNKNFVKNPIKLISSHRIRIDELENKYGNIILPVESQNSLYRPIEFINNSLHGPSAMFFHDYLEWARNNKLNTNATKIEDISQKDVIEFLEQSDEWESTTPKEDSEQITKIVQEKFIWITPGTPFIFFMFIGILLTVAIGNPILYFLI